MILAIANFIAPKIRPNLLTRFCDFDTPHTWNVIDEKLVGTVETSNTQVYEGKNSVEIDFANVGSIAFNSGGSQMNFTATKDGDYCLQGQVYTSTNDNLTVTFEVFVNGISTNTTFQSVLTTENGLKVGFNTLCQTFPLTAGDVVSFNFRFGNLVVPRKVYLDALKLELINDGVYAPSAYSVTPYDKNNWHRTQDFVSSQVIPANTRTKLLFVGSERKNNDVSLIANNDGALVPSPDLRITPTELLASLGTNGLFTTPTPSGTNQTVIVELESNSVVYRTKTHHFSKATGVVDTIDYVFLTPVEEDFLQYGGYIYITSTSAITISNRYLFVNQTRN